MEQEVNLEIEDGHKAKRPQATEEKYVTWELSAIMVSLYYCCYAVWAVADVQKKLQALG